MNRLTVFVIASRPKTLVATFSPTLLALCLAMSQGFFSPLIFVITLLTGLLIQVGTNFTNDYCDYVKGADTKERKGFLRVTQAGLIDPASLKKASILIFAIALILGAYLALLFGPPIALLLCLYVALSILYTAGPYPLGYMGLGDILVFFLYGPGACLITYYLQTDHLSWKAFVVGLCPGALSTSILAINNIRDVEEDRKANKKTLVVRFGKKAGQQEFLFLISFAFLIPFLLCFSHPFTLLCYLALPQALFLVRAIFKNKDPYQLNPLFEKMGKLLWLFTFLLCIGLLM